MNADVTLEIAPGLQVVSSTMKEAVEDLPLKPCILPSMSAITGESSQVYAMTALDFRVP